MSLVKNCSKILPDALFPLVALALIACLPPAAQAQVVSLFVSGTGDPSPVPSCFVVATQSSVLETSGAPGNAVDFDSAGATVAAVGFPSSLSCPSLRAAIRHANTNGNSGTDTIVLQGGSVYTLSIRGPNEDDALTGDLDIRSNVRITAAATALGNFATVRGSFWDDRIFDVLAGVVQIENLVTVGGRLRRDFGGGIRNQGTLTLGNCIVRDGLTPDLGGGGIVNTGTLTMTNCSVFANESESADGGGILNQGILTLTNIAVHSNSAGSDGGGIHNKGKLTLTNTTVGPGNFAGGDGGGIFNGRNATLTNSKVESNEANGAGGGIANINTLELTGTTVSSNRTGDRGAGIRNLGILRITRSTISSNSGAGIFNTGGILNPGFIPSLTLNDSTVSSNAGDGIVNSDSGIVTLNNATIARNMETGVKSLAAPVSFSNTILDVCEGAFTSHDYNLVQFPSAACNITIGTATHDKFGVDPFLGELRFNGGQTNTHKPGSGSLAIDNGNPAQVGSLPPACSSTDQVGATRPVDGDRLDPDGLSGPLPAAVCDIGSVEVRPLLINPNVTCCVIVATSSGILDLTPAEATVRVGERFTYAFEWTVPQGGWRTLDTLELRLVDGDEVILQVRFAEAADPPGSLGTFSLVDEKTGREGPRFAPGSRNRLENESATVYLNGSAAHGPPGSTVGLTLELSFKRQAGGRSYAVEVLATEDAGAETGFVAAGTVTVLPAKP